MTDKFDRLLSNVFRPLITNIHELVKQLIDQEENSRGEIKTLLTAPWEAETRPKIEVELMLFQNMFNQMTKMLRIHKKLRNTIEEYLELKGWRGSCEHEVH